MARMITIGLSANGMVRRRADTQSSAIVHYSK